MYSRYVHSKERASYQLTLNTMDENTQPTTAPVVPATEGETVVTEETAATEEAAPAAEEVQA